MKKTLSGTNSRENDFGELNPNELVEEWVKQDRLVGDYGPRLALAKRRLEEAKTAAQIFEVETARRIRQKPKQYGVLRLTEGAIKEAVAVLLLTSKVHDKLIDAKYKVDMLEAAMRRLEHRKKGLSDLVYLHGQQYFSTPTTPRNANIRDKVERRKSRSIRGIRGEDN